MWVCKVFCVLWAFFVKFVFVLFSGRNVCREADGERNAEVFVLDYVGVPVCGFPVAEEVFLSSFGCVCILSGTAGVPQEGDL